MMDGRSPISSTDSKGWFIHLISSLLLSECVCVWVFMFAHMCLWILISWLTVTNVLISAQSTECSSSTRWKRLGVWENVFNSSTGITDVDYRKCELLVCTLKMFLPCLSRHHIVSYCNVDDDIHNFNTKSETLSDQIW